MTVYCDASVVVSLVVEETGSHAAAFFFYNYDGRLLISDFAAAEVASAISRHLRTGELDIERAQNALRDLDSLRLGLFEPVQITSADIATADRFVRTFDLELRAPDAIHIAAARRLGVDLVTLDRRMARAARKLGIAVDEPGQMRP